LRGILTVGWCLLTGLSFAAEPPPWADQWLAGAGPGPAATASALVDSNAFATLRAEVAAGALVVKCDGPETWKEARLLASADAPGHWPCRDWRTIPMRRAGANWLAEIPIDSVDVPVIYLMLAVENRASVASPLRLVHPRVLGLEKPSRLFWAFIEGFEQGLEGWQSWGGTITTAPTARSGKSSLSVRVPAGRQAVSVGTTRLRGWFLQETGSDGVGIWMRTRKGEGAAAFSLTGQAFSTNQVVSRRAETFRISTNWSRARLTFDSFPKPPLAELDLFTIEIAAAPGTEVLLDDLHLLGRWAENF